MKCEDILHILRTHSPEEYACDWDNVGLLVGDSKREVTCVYIALDATEEVVADAIKAKASLLITHHPVIFKGLKRIATDHSQGRILLSLIENNINCYAMHTNFDVSAMADLAEEKIGLVHSKVLEVMVQQAPLKGIGKIGQFAQQKSLKQSAQLVKEAFGLEGVRVYGDTNTLVKTIAIVPGSGKSYINEALKQGADLLITGDVDHHSGIDAVAEGLCIIDAGHYGLEYLFVSFIKEYIANCFDNLEIKTQPVTFPYFLV